MIYNRESSLHNSFYSFSNYVWNSTKCQPLSIRAVTKNKYFMIECIKQDTYTMKIECLMFALYFSFAWGGHKNVLGLALISIWKKVIFRKINIFGLSTLASPLLPAVIRFLHRHCRPGGTQREHSCLWHLTAAGVR